MGGIECYQAVGEEQNRCKWIDNEEKEKVEDIDELCEQIAVRFVKHISGGNPLDKDQHTKKKEYNDPECGLTQKIHLASLA